MPNTRSLVILILLLCSVAARAQELYSGEVMVSGQGVEERNQSLQTALIQVLQKQSGRRELPTGAALDSALLSASRIMTSFNYRARKRFAPDGGSRDELWLVVRFLPDAVNRMVRDLELPRWRHERQPVTIWIVVDDGLGRRLMPLEYGYAWDAMADIASMRGLPVAWPDLAEETVQQVDLQLLWGGFTEPLLDGGSEYGGVLIIAARRQGPEWNIRWNYAAGEQTAGWRNHDRDLSFALVDGVHRLTDMVASQNSIAGAAHGEWQLPLDVRGLAGAADYERCLGYLQGLSLVNKVDVQEAGPGGVRFILQLNALPEFFEETLARDQVLEPGQFEHEYRLLP